MAYIPAESGGGGGYTTTTYNFGTNDNRKNIPVDDYAYIELTPPETGYIPIGWCMSNFYALTQGKFMYLNGGFRKSSGNWRLIIGNVGASDVLGLASDITVLWVKP